MRTESGAMVDPWQLPRQVTLGGQQVEIRADFRAVLQVLAALSDGSLPRFARWRRGLFLFYGKPIAPHLRQEAMERLEEFINCGKSPQPGPKLLDWQHDGQLIAAEVNAVAGREIRQEEFLHWWTFLGYFNAIGNGALAQIVALRDKLRRGKPLTAGEKQWYMRNKEQIRLPDDPEVAAAKAALEHLLRSP